MLYCDLRFTVKHIMLHARYKTSVVVQCVSDRFCYIQILTMDGSKT